MIVVVDIAADTMVAFYTICGWPQVRMLVLERPPESFDEHIVDCPPLAIHAQPYPCMIGNIACEHLRGELTALVGVEDIRCSVLLYGFLYHLFAPLGAHGVAQ